jgi:uncharacterized protein YjbI with pentapeptide repeats
LHARNCAQPPTTAPVASLQAIHWRTSRYFDEGLRVVLLNPEPRNAAEREEQLRTLVESWNEKLKRRQIETADLPPEPVGGREIPDGVYQGPFWDVQLGRTDLIWLSTHPELSTDLSGADFAGADLKDVTAEDISFVCCNWARAQLDRARVGRDLRQSDFRRTSLRGADLSDCRLGGADLRNAQMDSGTDLSSADFGYSASSRAWLADVGWNGASLAQVKWEPSGEATRTGKPIKTFQTKEDVEADRYEHILREAATSRRNARWRRLLVSIARWLLLVLGYPARQIRRLAWLPRLLRPAVRPFRGVLGRLISGARTHFPKVVATVNRPALHRLVLYAPKYRIFTLEHAREVAKIVGFKELDAMGAKSDSDGQVDWTGFASILSDSPEHGREADGELSRIAGLAFDDAVRANTQLATELRRQGLGPEADHFAFQARRAQQRVWRLNRSWGRVIANRTLRALCGYGFRPSLLLWWYAAVNTCAVISYLIADRTRHQHPDVLGAITLSLTAFHGRGFVASGLPTLTSPAAAIAAAEAVIGLFVEATFVGTFVQRVLT